MSSDALSNLAKIGKIKAEPMNRAEIDRMLVMARKRFADSGYTQVSQEDRFPSVYNEIHGAALAALRWHGYRSENRYIVSQSLGHTLAWPTSRWRVFDAAHQKRNLAEYEDFLEIEESAITELRLLAEKLFADVDRPIGADKDTNIAYGCCARVMAVSIPLADLKLCGEPSSTGFLRGARLVFNLENALKVNTLLLALLMCMPFLTLAQHNHAGQTPYAGMQNRAIKSLSDNDINELRRGGGWGLALAAELNGMPGPSHLLELKDKIPLAADQVNKTQVLLEEMRKAAIPTGERLIAAEKALESAFASGKVDEPSLRRLLADAESARSELRFIHLSQHYKTVLFLTPEQIKRYNILRGYADDPCKNIPAGHNPEMYKRHMGCN